MKERPILFSGPMVRAILEGRKTQTRRVIAEKFLWGPLSGREYTGPNAYDDWADDWETHHKLCPYGAPGDRLWVREAWTLTDGEWVDGEYSYEWCMTYAADGEAFPEPIMWRTGGNKPSIHMPRGLSRITLEVTGIRVERLQEISEEDARAEGVVPFPLDPNGDCWTDGKHRTAYNYLWNEINGWSPNAWDANPWVWVVEFRRVVS